MEASYTPTWEACKENVLPIKRGRSAKGLSESLQNNADDASGNNPRDKIFEDSIIAAAKSSPKELLDAYSLYFKWTRDTYPTNTERALKLLERCTCDLKDKEELKNDHKFVKMWIEYADMVKTPGEIFSFMQSNKIGEKVALFWIAWAYVAEKSENFKLTDQIFQKGIRRLAEPKDTLSKRYQQFQRRLARHYLNSMESNPADDDNTTPHTMHDSATHTNTNTHSMNENIINRGEERGRERRVLGGLTAAQASSDNRHPHPSHQPLSHSQSLPQPLPLTSSAPVPVRTSHAVSTSTSRNVRAVSTSSSVRSTVEDRSSNATFRIFSDNPDTTDRAASELTENQNWRNLGVQSVKTKENDGPVMKWTDGGGLPGHYTGPGQHVSGTHGPSSTTAPLSSIISIFVDKEFENNNEVEEEEEGKYEGERRGRGKESSKEEQNSPNIKRSRTQIPGGLKLRQQLDGAQQDSLISRIASNPLERHKRMTENLPLSDQNRESEIRQSNSEKIKNGNQQNGVHTAQDIHSSHQARHTAPTLPTTTTSFPTSLSAIPTFSIFEDEDKKTEKETDKSLTFSATSFQIFEDKEGENEKKKNEVLGGSALERMRNKEKERKTERDKERERENVREREKERERESVRVREKESVTQRERDRKAEEQSAQNKRMKTKSAHNNSDLDAMLLEMGVGDSEDGTINTRLARADIDSMFCSPSSSKSDIINRKYESNNNYDNDFQNSCYSNTKYQNNHDQINGQSTIEHLNNLNTSKQFDIKNHKNKNNNEPELKIFTYFKSQNIIQNNCDNINERKYTNENENEYDNKKKFEKTKDKEIERNFNDNDNYKGDDSYSNRLSLEMDDVNNTNNMNNITSRKGSMDSLTSESLNLNFAWAGDNVHVHTLGASTNELSVIKERGVNDYDYSIFGQLNTPHHEKNKDGCSLRKENNRESKNTKFSSEIFTIYSDNNDDEKNEFTKTLKTEKADFRHNRDEKTESDYNSLYLSGSSNSTNSINISRRVSDSER